MRLSKIGLVLSGLYLVLTVAVLVWSLFITGDPKGAFVLKQLPIVLPIGLAVSLGLAPLLEGLSWTGAYLLFLPPTLLCLYVLGWIISWLGRV